MPRISTSRLKQLNQERWETATYHGRHTALAAQIAQRLVAPRAKAVYQAIERDTGVPWWVVAVIHQREASQRWSRSIAQGDPWNQVSRHHPRGRGPFGSFHEAAIDALCHCHPYAARWGDWSPGGALTLLEMYNGTGYESFHNMASPYIWSGTNHYVRGKYVADHKFDPHEVDQQMGCAVLIKEMARLDPSVRFAPSLHSTPMPQLPDTERPSPKADGMEMDVETDGVPLPPPKPMSSSKIGWLSQILAFLGIGGAGSTLSDNVWSTITNAANKPQFWVFLAVGVVAFLIFYYRWRDHGRGRLFR